MLPSHTHVTRYDDIWLSYHNNAEYSSIQEVETDQEVSVILSYTEAILVYMRLCFKKINKFLPDLEAEV